MDFMTVKEASILWNIDVSRIGKLLKEGRIAGAEKTGGHWYIPRGAAKPIDRRTRQRVRETEPGFFRFPLLVNKDEKQFYPPLTEDEILLRRAQVDFFAYDFEKATVEFEHLEKHTKSVYIRISALFFQCILAVAHKKGNGFQDCLHKLNLEFKGDFPYKREMELFLPWLYSYLGFFTSASEYLAVEPDYDYHPSVYPLLSYLTFYHGIRGSLSTINVDVYVILCKQLERDRYFCEAQELHIVLFLVYCSFAEEKAARYHLRQALDIAMEHNLLIMAACYESYYPDAYHAVLREYPKAFAEKVLICSAHLHDSYAYFAASNGITEMYNILSENDYQYILYAVQGFKYREIAKFMKISERTVASKYSKIYEKLGIKNKQELIHLFYDVASMCTDPLSRPRTKEFK